MPPSLSLRRKHPNRSDALYASPNCNSPKSHCMQPRIWYSWFHACVVLLLFAWWGWNAQIIQFDSPWNDRPWDHHSRVLSISSLWSCYSRILYKENHSICCFISGTSLNIMPRRSILVCVHSSFLLTAGQYFHCVNRPQFNHATVCGDVHFSSFHYFE